MNQTYECQCGLDRSSSASYCGGRMGITFFHNNSTEITVTSMRSSFSLETSPFVEGTTGFCQSTNCRGGPCMAVYFDRDSLLEIISIINSTILPGRGLFSLYYSYTATLKDFIIEVKEQRNWLDTTDCSGTNYLVLKSCKLLGYVPPDSKKVSASDCSLGNQLFSRESERICGFFAGRIRTCFLSSI